VALAVKPPSPQKAIIPLNNPGSAQGGFAACDATNVTVRASGRMLKIMLVERSQVGEFLADLDSIELFGRRDLALYVLRRVTIADKSSPAAEHDGIYRLYSAKATT
jgi:hypothetical protein